KLKVIKKKFSGRDNQGHVAVRHRGGEQKRFLRTIDFRRDKFDIPGKVVAIEYDPNRTADIALIQYADGEKRYVLAPVGLRVHDTILSSKNAEVRLGNSTTLSAMPIGTFVHNIELTP